MKPAFSEKKIMGKLSILLNGDKKEFVITQTVAVLFFFIVALGDVLFFWRHHSIAGAIIIMAIFLLQAFAILALPDNKNRFLAPPIVFFIATAAIVSLAVSSGYPAGSYYYYFPAAMLYFVSSSPFNHTKRFGYFIGITLLFSAALLLYHVFFPQQVSPAFEHQSMAYRFLGAVLLSAILLKYLFALQAYIQHTDGRKQYHEALFQSYLDGYIIFNHETREVVDYNKRMAALFELPPELDLKKLYFTQVMMRYLAEDSANKQLIMDNIPDYWQGEAGFITHKKEKFYGYVKSVVYYKDENKYQVLSIRDITHTKDAESELNDYKESLEKAGKAKARFLSSMSHELRTPLNGIIGACNLIKSEATLPAADLEKHIDVLLYSSEHMLGIINDILDFSKIDAGKLELNKKSFNVKGCIQNLSEAFDTQFKNKNIQLVIEPSLPLEDVYVVSDEIKLSQVIANLLSNALKFTLEGTVTLAVKVNSITKEKTIIQFEVKDTGIGIPKDKQVEIFQGFAQVHAAGLSRRFDGAGLGLTISEKLVHIFGGKLEVESELEKGSRFYFTIAFETSQQSPGAIEKKTPPVADIRGIKILIVEDNMINATILKSFLKKWEIQIKEAENGVHALEMLKYHRFDLILMDLEMPEMDGHTAIKIIRKTDTTTPVLAFTASLLENMDAYLEEAGFNGYVLKPYRPADLKSKIELFAPHRKMEY